MSVLVRKEKRVRLGRVFRILQTSQSGRIGGRTITKNLSFDGARIQSDRKLRGGSVLEAMLSIRKFCPHRVKVFCRVAWSQPADTAGRFDAGLEFIGMKDTYRKCYHEYLSMRANAA